jgi:dephospho-CoA kinase
MQSIKPLTGVSKKTVAKFLEDAGKVRTANHDASVHNLQSKRIQRNEMGSLVGMKGKNILKQKDR